MQPRPGPRTCFPFPCILRMGDWRVGLPPVKATQRDAAFRPCQGCEAANHLKPTPERKRAECLRDRYRSYSMRCSGKGEVCGRWPDPPETMSNRRGENCDNPGISQLTEAISVISCSCTPQSQALDHEGVLREGSDLARRPRLLTLDAARAGARTGRSHSRAHRSREGGTNTQLRSYHDTSLRGTRIIAISVLPPVHCIHPSPPTTPASCFPK